ncbi:MAG: lipopolysaccharide biosynthesis protein, partial [Hyphomicrobiaceae bacterium]
MTTPSNASATAETTASPSLLQSGRDRLETLIAAIRSDTDRGHTQRAALTVFFIRICSAAIAFASQAALARWMGSFEYGIFVFVWVWVLILSVISSTGLNVLMMRLVPQYTEQKEFGLLRGLLFRGRLIIFGLATCFAGTAMAVLYFAPGLVQSHYVFPAYIVFFCVPLIVLTDAQDCIGRGYSWMRLALIPPYILRPLLLLIFMCAASLSGFPMMATTAAGCAVAACFATYLTQTVILQRRLTVTIPAGAREYQMKFWMLTALPILFVEGIDLLLYNTDVLLISHYMTPSDVGIYFASLKTIGLVSFVHYAVGSSIANRVAAYKARGDTEQLEAFVRDAAAWTFWPSLIG